MSAAKLLDTIAHLERVESTHFQCIDALTISGEHFLIYRIPVYECRNIVGDAPLYAFNDSTISMPLLEVDDYFHRQAKLSFDPRPTIRVWKRLL